jgi:transposase
MPEVEVAESTIRRYVRERKIELGLTGRETFIPQSYSWGAEAQVDWYEAFADICGERQLAYIFCMRSMASGGAFHCAFPHASQQAFLEAHERAFDYFGGVFKVLRYDNLKSAVKKVLRGHQREETTRFIAFRSHWASSFLWDVELLRGDAGSWVGRRAPKAQITSGGKDPPEQPSAGLGS